MGHRQYTFIDYQQENRERLSEDYQVIDSNFNSPSHFENNISSNNSS